MKSFLATFGFFGSVVAFAVLISNAFAAEVPSVTLTEGQPLAANVKRVLQSLEFLGAPLPSETLEPLGRAIESENVSAIQSHLDPQVLFVVEINPEIRVKVRRGPALAVLQQGGFTPVLVKVVNQGTTTERLRILSPQAGQVYGGMSSLSATRMQRTALKETDDLTGDPKRFLDVSMYESPPMTDRLSGLEVEYAIALIYSREPGRREATIAFDVGQGNQDLGFRAEVPVLFEVRPAVRVKLDIRDYDGEPTTARLVFRDAGGRVYPPQGKRLAPDFYFQEQIYRSDGDVVLLPSGRLTVESSRGPEYRVLRGVVEIPEKDEYSLEFRLQRWIHPAIYGFYSGDHHIHGAGCAHYTSPTLGVRPEDMFLQVKGEGLNVGCVLTWGPCFEFQRQFFSPQVDRLSEAFTVMKYDLEISGFGSAALGHVCLLNLKDQTYPGSAGTKDKGWPTWTTPVMRWAKEQGGIAGYAHSASGLQINSSAAADRMFGALDRDQDGLLTKSESTGALLPKPFAAIDQDSDQVLAKSELGDAIDRAADELPNLAIPEMNSVGAMEICVSTAEGVCDFISAMDTARIPEWNMWYHILNCGFPLKVSGETDFPCMSGSRVGQGRVYVHLGDIERVDFAEWCEGLARGRSYVSDGFAHAVDFQVDGVRPGFGEVSLDRPGVVSVSAKVAFAPETPLSVAQGRFTPPGGRRFAGDTVTFHGPPPASIEKRGERRVEIVANGNVVGTAIVPADGAIHDLEFRIQIEKSAWIALRHFPQLHTNPVNVLIDGKPIRASRNSALWCIETIRQLWRVRSERIAQDEREEARRAFDRAIETYRQIADEATSVEQGEPDLFQ